MRQVDNGTLKNSDIRENIGGLFEIDEKISFGQAQKVINVSLKQYCFIANKVNLYKELDCPLDSKTMMDYNINHKRMIDVTKIDYEEYQDQFNKEFDGIKVLRDMKYDEDRINNFLKL
jgi:hypothetical protein